MLLGEVLAKIDAKKRIIIPYKFRSYFNDKKEVIISKGFDGCLVMRSQNEFIKWQDKILSQSEGKEETRILMRHIFANSEQLAIDAKGRINIPQPLLALVDIKNEVIVIGLSNKIEIWSNERWEKFKNKTKDKFESSAATLNEI